MSELSQCHDVIDSSKRVVRLTFDLLGEEALLVPERLAVVLASKPVQEAIQKALHDDAAALLQDRLAGKSADPDAAALVQRVGENVGTPLGREYLRVLEEAPRYRQLTGAAQQVIDDFNCTPTGVFISQNKTLLTVVGIVLVVGGAIGLYVARTGDFLAKPLAGEGKEVKLGKVTVGAKLLQFEPSKRAVKIDLSVAPPGPFKGIITGATEEGKFAAATDGTIALPLGRGFAIDFGYHLSLSAIPTAPNVRSLVLQGIGDTSFDYRLFAKGRFATGEKAGEDGFSLEFVAAVQNDMPSLALTSGYRTTDPHLKLGASFGVDLQPRGASARGTVGLSGMWSDYPWRFDATGRFGHVSGPGQGAQLLSGPATSVHAVFTLYVDPPVRPHP